MIKLIDLVKELNLPSDPDHKDTWGSPISSNPAQLALFPWDEVSTFAYRPNKGKENVRTEKEDQLMHIIDPKINDTIKNIFGPNVKWKHLKPAERGTWQGDDSAGNGADVYLSLEVTPTSGPGVGKPLEVYGQVPVAGKVAGDGPMAGLPLMSVGLSVNKSTSHKKNPFDTKQLEMFREWFMTLPVGVVKRAKDEYHPSPPRSFQKLLNKYQYAKAIISTDDGGDEEMGYGFDDIVTQYYDDYKKEQNFLGRARLK